MKTKKYPYVLLYVLLLAAMIAICSNTAAAAPVKIVFSIPAWGDKPATDPMYQEIRDIIKQKLNVIVEWGGEQNAADAEQKPRLMLAAGEQIDGFYTNEWMSHMRSGSIAPINELLNAYGKDILKKVIPQSIKLRTTSDGKTWQVPWESNPISLCTYVRKDWLDELGLKLPVTIAEFEALLQTFKDKKNWRGMTAYGSTWTDLFDEQFAGSFISTGNQNWVDVDGKIKPSYLNPAYKDFLAKMQEWYRKGYIHKEFATMSVQQVSDLENSAQGGVWCNYADSGVGAIIENRRTALSLPKYNLVSLPPLRGTQPGLYSKNLAFNWGSCISASSKNKEAVMKFYNYVLATEEGFLLTNYGIEGKHWVWSDRAKGLLKLPEGTKPEQQYVNESIFQPGYLVSLGNSFCLNLKGRDFVIDMNDSGKVRASYPIDFGVVYDRSVFISKDQIAALDAMRDSAKFEIIMAQKPVSYWTEVMRDWMEKGGREYIEDMTKQFNAAKAK